MNTDDDDDDEDDEEEGSDLEETEVQSSEPVDTGFSLLEGDFLGDFLGTTGQKKKKTNINKKAVSQQITKNAVNPIPGKQSVAQLSDVIKPNVTVTKTKKKDEDGSDEIADIVESIVTGEVDDSAENDDEEEDDDENDDEDSKETKGVTEGIHNYSFEYIYHNPIFFYLKKLQMMKMTMMKVMKKTMSTTMRRVATLKKTKNQNTGLIGVTLRDYSE